ncbi:hypothetical protein NX059_002784 [Plenodomus lindquistii]|nr:hypothetical protein NX059_002784 [Plenodomus lindquistii]
MEKRIKKLSWSERGWSIEGSTGTRLMSEVLDKRLNKFLVCYLYFSLPSLFEASETGESKQKLVGDLITPGTTTQADIQEVITQSPIVKAKSSVAVPKASRAISEADNCRRRRIMKVYLQAILFVKYLWRANERHDGFTSMVSSWGVVHADAFFAQFLTQSPRLKTDFYIQAFQTLDRCSMFFAAAKKELRNLQEKARECDNTSNKKKHKEEPTAAPENGSDTTSISQKRS